jgi:hypothetical protein
MTSTTRSTSPIASAREQLPTTVRSLAWWISHHSVLGVQSMQSCGYGCIAEHACTHCRTHSEGARDIRCVRLLRFLHNCAPVLQQARGKRGGQPTEVSCTNRYYNPTVAKLSGRPNLNGKDKPRCTKCPAHCPICKTVVWKYAMEQQYSTKHAGIDLPAHFMIRPLEKAAMGKMKMLHAAAVPA